MENNKEYRKTEQLWQRIAGIAGGFSLIICILIIINFFQINRDDPVNTLVMDNLVERLNLDPQDEELRKEVRALDLLARKAYFTNQWQIRIGGYLLLMGVAVVIISMQVIQAIRKKVPVISDEDQDDFIKKQKKARQWIAAGGTLVVVIALISAFLSHRSLEEKFTLAATPELQENEQVLVEEPPMDEQEATTEAEGLVNEEQPVIADSEEQLGVEDELEKQVNVEEKKEDEKPVVVVPKGASSVFANFRGPGSNGITVQKNIPIDWDGATGKNILWKIAVPLGGFNSPVIWGDRLFLSGADKDKREVYAYDVNNGNLLWTTSVTNVPGSPAKSPEVANYTGHAAPTMATDGSMVFAIFSNGDIVALDMDGKQLWAKNLGVPVNHYGYSSSLIVYNEKVIVQYDQKNVKKVLALSATTGDELWSTKRDVKISWASPVIVSTGSRMELILAAEPLVISYNPDTGEELWRIEGVSGEVGPSIAYADGIIFAVNDYSRLVAIQTGSEPSIIWEDEELLSDVPSPVATDDCLIMPTSYGVIACYNTKTGEKFWEHEVDNTIYASPLISEGKVYLVDKQGVTHIFKADKEFTSLGTPELGEKIVCTPAFSEGRIFLRGYNHLFCVGEK